MIGKTIKHEKTGRYYVIVDVLAGGDFSAVPLSRTGFVRWRSPRLIMRDQARLMDRKARVVKRDPKRHDGAGLASDVHHHTGVFNV